jgi:hypothetical protein
VVEDEELTKEEQIEDKELKEEQIEDKEQTKDVQQIEDVNYKSDAIFLISSSIPLLKSVSIVQPNCFTFSLLI